MSIYTTCLTSKKGEKRQKKRKEMKIKKMGGGGGGEASGHNRTPHTLFVCHGAKGGGGWGMCL